MSRRQSVFSFGLRFLSVSAQISQAKKVILHCWGWCIPLLNKLRLCYCLLKDFAKWRMKFVSSHWKSHFSNGVIGRGGAHMSRFLNWTLCNIQYPMITGVYPNTDISELLCLKLVLLVFQKIWIYFQWSDKNDRICFHFSIYILGHLLTSYCHLSFSIYCPISFLNL